MIHDRWIQGPEPNVLRSPTTSLPDCANPATVVDMTPALECLSNALHPSYGPVLRSSRQARYAASGALSMPTAKAIHKLRMYSGLGWDDLARLLRVPSEDIDAFASGKTMAPSQEEHLRMVLGVVEKMDRGSARENLELLSVERDGMVPLDALSAGRYAQVLAAVGVGPGRQERPKIRLSREEEEARRPLPPDVLVSALHDPIHPPCGHPLASYPLDIPRSQ